MADNIVITTDINRAVELLNGRQGRALLMVGCEDLAAFQAVARWEDRLFACVPPRADVIARAEDIGFRGRHLIGIQGPLAKEMLAALVQTLGIATLINEAAGDLPEQLRAARQCGAEIIAIGKRGDSACASNTGRTEAPPGKPPDSSGPGLYPRFPLFVSLQGREVLVVGGGAVAARRVRALLGFGALVTAVTPSLCAELQALCGALRWVQGPYQALDRPYTLAVAATNHRAVNRRVGMDCSAAGIPVSVADSKEESTFWFPAIARHNGLVAGLVSVDGDHKRVRGAAETIRNCLKEI